MKMYKTFYGINIIEKEITKETEHSVYYIGENNKEVCDRKKTNMHEWHLTKEAAINCLKKKYQLQLKSAESQIDYAKDALNKLDQMKYELGLIS